LAFISENEKAFFAVFVFDEINALVDGDAIQPSFMGRFGFKLMQGSVHLNKYILGDFLSVFGVLNIIQCHVVHQDMVLIVNVLKVNGMLRHGCKLTVFIIDRHECPN
jgi:hypothetical protein